MNIGNIEKILVEAVKRLNKKFPILWPSNENTPPTESNITTACVEAFSESEFLVFTEVPIKGGRFDFMAYNKNFSALVLGEMKSDKGNYAMEIKDDYNRMISFKEENIIGDHYFGRIDKIFIFIGYWTEREDRIKELSNIDQHPDHELFHIIKGSENQVKFYQIADEGLHLFFFAKELKN